jgi:hypothetical protein
LDRFIYDETIVNDWTQSGMKPIAVVDTATSMIAVPEEYHLKLSEQWRKAVNDDD